MYSYHTSTDKQITEAKRIQSKCQQNSTLSHAISFCIRALTATVTSENWRVDQMQISESDEIPNQVRDRNDKSSQLGKCMKILEL